MGGLCCQNGGMEEGLRCQSVGMRERSEYENGEGSDVREYEDGEDSDVSVEMGKCSSGSLILGLVGDLKIRK